MASAGMTWSMLLRFGGSTPCQSSTRYKGAGELFRCLAVFAWMVSVSQHCCPYVPCETINLSFKPLTERHMFTKHWGMHCTEAALTLSYCVQSTQSMQRRVWYAEMHAYALGAAKEGVHHLASNSSVFHMGYYHPHGATCPLEIESLFLA